MQVKLQIEMTLSQVLNHEPTARKQCKAPEFDGTLDVKCFIQHFVNVAEENEWTDYTTLLHL